MTTPTRARGARTPEPSPTPSKTTQAASRTKSASKRATSPKVAAASKGTSSSKGVSSPKAADSSKVSATASSNGTRAAARAASRDPDGGDGVLHSLLTAAVDEAARLLHADGAMVYLIDHKTGNLRFAHDAGIKRARTREWIRALELAPGVGMFGQATATRSVVVTSDYSNDASFRHSPGADRVVDDLGITSMVVTFSFKAFFDGIGKTHVHMISAIVMNVGNIVLCVAFIFGNWGAPRMGIAGAGLAAFVSTWVGLFIMAVWAASAKYRHEFHPFAFAKRRWPVTRDILKLSIPSGVATLAVMTGFMLFSFIVSKLDEMTGAAMVKVVDSGPVEPVNGAATMVIVAVLKLTFTACLAFGTSTATLVSQSLGAGDPDKAARFGWASVRLGLVIFAVVGFLEGVVFPREILSIFTTSPAVLEAALMPMQVMGFCTPLIAVAMILTQALFGAGNTRFVMIVELILHFTCLVPLAWILGVTLEFGLMGIWSSAVIYVVALTAIMVHKFARGDWRSIHI